MANTARIPIALQTAILYTRFCSSRSRNSPSDTLATAVPRIAKVWATISSRIAFARLPLASSPNMSAVLWPKPRFADAVMNAV